MALGKRTKRVLIGMVLSIAIAAVGYQIYRAATRVDIDLSPLEPFIATESYDALVERVREHEIGEAGFRFVVLGDTRSFYFRARNVLLRAAEEKPVLILSNGDIVQKGTVEEYVEHHFKLMEDIDWIPFFVAPGNHEEGPNDDFSSFKAIYGDTRFSFDFGGCRFIGINNGDFNKMGGSDLRYLDRELSKLGAKHKFVTFHVPPEFLENAIESEGHRGFSWNAKRFHKLMVKHGVDQVFSGHVHGYATEVLDGVRYTITGGAGAALTDKLGEAGKVHNFVVVTVTDEGLTSEVIKLIHGEWVREAME